MKKSMHRLLIIIGTSIAAVSAGIFVFVAHNPVIDFSVLDFYEKGKPSVLLDDEGNIWARFELDRRDPLPYVDMPKHLINAVIATEDHNFFNHPGISLRGIVRMMFVNIYHMRFAQGASTITQQLVRLMFFDARKTITRKIKEMLVALLVERQYTKEQILETYLNHVCFGSGIYGVEAAAQRFWGISARDISIAQSATLASILKNPERYCLLNSVTRVKSRRDTMLKSMYNLGFIAQKDLHNALLEPIAVVVQRSDKIAPHVKESIRVFMEPLVGRAQLYGGGLVIQTTINQKIQREAERCFHQQFSYLRKKLSPAVDGALISVEPKTGQIKALIGGYDFSMSQFNRAMRARRQMGSIIKPIVYAAAIAQGASFADIDIDEPIEFSTPTGLWQPKNCTGTFDGSMTLARALSLSINTICIKVFMRAGRVAVAQLAQKCRLPEPINSYPSLALGCIDVTPLEAVGLFNVFANDGVYVCPHLIKWVKNQFGEKIYRCEHEVERVLNSRVAGKVAKVLSIGVSGYVKRLKQQPFMSEAIGKTGTTNDSRTCWFCGATPQLTTALYIGKDDNSSLGASIYPISTIVPIWLALYRSIEKEARQFVYDPSLKEVTINWKNGQILSDGDHMVDAVSIFI
jgi:penicillin-binding protein 1A